MYLKKLRKSVTQKKDGYKTQYYKKKEFVIYMKKLVIKHWKNRKCKL